MRLKLTLAFIAGFLCASAQSLKLSVPHGFYSKPFTLNVTGGDALIAEGGTIRYTLDGSLPTKSSAAFVSPLEINGNTIIRVAVIAGDTIASDVATATYLFVDDVLRQPSWPEDYPKMWGRYTQISGRAPADYGMDPEMTEDPALADKIREGLLSLPVLSIVTDKDNLFNNVNDPDKGGIYIFTGPPQGDDTGHGWTRPASVELFGGEQIGADGKGTGLKHNFTVPCGLRLHGGHGRMAEKNPKHSFRLVFKSEYGQKNLQYPLFGKGEPDKFGQLVLRCHFGNSWQHRVESSRLRAQYTRDVWARRMQRKMGWTSVNALYVHLFLNGMYWGMYNIAERIDDQFGKDHIGGKKDDIDVIKVEESGGNHLEASEGDMDAWQLMIETTQKASNNIYYNKLQGKNSEGVKDPNMEPLLDIDAFIDYMLINQYGGNTDWDHHNWYAIRRKGTQSEGFRFLCWDTESVFESLNDNVVNQNKGTDMPTGIFNNLLKNDDFAKRYLRRARAVLSTDGLLGQESVVEVWDSLYNVVSMAIYAEAARWGDYRRDVHPYERKGILYTVDDTYMAERQRLLEEYFPARTAKVLAQIQSKVNINLDDDESGIHEVTLSEEKRGRFMDGRYRNLQGQVVEPSVPGIYIRNGKLLWIGK